ncbi:hypothetical protein SAE02_11320 [Skermanella aerolata]|uniref:DUF1640 domain-containing protein n=1 Tax=Skermanella aerolata TaxID=393310 RepID=A0A512DKI4_9PROT|nr:hypothetical protein [Skermanella aerolata]KJB97177.1 hypothetical protein N826_28150 [Skermanella aerolata KACC 11604]GEO36984.1 hypothetical protein SAE02_11320 [Skermanella aerolata]
MGAAAILKLERAGFTHEQVDALAEYLDDQAATKADVGAVKAEISAVRDELTAKINQSRLEGKSELAEFRAATRAEFVDLRLELSGMKAESKFEFAAVRSEITLLEQRMTIKLGAMLAIAVGVVGTMVKLL